jgi:hypothetical protein
MLADSEVNASDDVGFPSSILPPNQVEVESEERQRVETCLSHFQVPRAPELPIRVIRLALRAAASYHLSRGDTEWFLGIAVSVWKEQRPNRNETWAERRERDDKAIFAAKRQLLERIRYRIEKNACESGKTSRGHVHLSPNQSIHHGRNMGPESLFNGRKCIEGRQGSPLLANYQRLWTQNRNYDIFVKDTSNLFTSNFSRVNNKQINILMVPRKKSRALPVPLSLADFNQTTPHEG